MTLVEEAQMSTVVVYESMFGNTKTIAEAIAEGLRGAGQVALGSVDDLSPDQAADARLLVVGGPTHGHGMARANAHQTLAKDGSYAKYGAVLAGGEPARLAGAPSGPGGGRGLRHPLCQAQVAHRVGRHQDRPAPAPPGLHGGRDRELLRPDRRRPLADGERERAVAWGRALAANLQPTSAT